MSLRFTVGVRVTAGTDVAGPLDVRVLPRRDVSLPPLAVAEDPPRRASFGGEPSAVPIGLQEGSGRAGGCPQGRGCSWATIGAPRRGQARHAAVQAGPGVLLRPAGPEGGAGLHRPRPAGALCVLLHPCREAFPGRGLQPPEDPLLHAAHPHGLRLGPQPSRGPRGLPDLPRLPAVPEAEPCPQAHLPAAHRSGACPRWRPRPSTAPRVPARTRTDSSSTQSSKPGDALCVLGLTLSDLYPCEAWSFTFGKFLPGHEVGVCSFARFSGDLLQSGPSAADPAPAEVAADSPETPVRDGGQSVGFSALGMVQCCKVTCHELCHLLGLGSCRWLRCLMQGALSLDEALRRPLDLCPICLRKLQHVLGFKLVERYKRLHAWTQARTRARPSPDAGLPSVVEDTLPGSADSGLSCGSTSEPGSSLSEPLTPDAWSRSFSGGPELEPEEGLGSLAVPESPPPLGPPREAIEEHGRWLALCIQALEREVTEDELVQDPPPVAGGQRRINAGAHLSSAVYPGCPEGCSPGQQRKVSCGPASCPRVPAEGPQALPGWHQGLWAWTSLAYTAGMEAAGGRGCLGLGPVYTPGGSEGLAALSTLRGQGQSDRPSVSPAEVRTVRSADKGGLWGPRSRHLWHRS
uniref:archaemetzincin-1 isoform X2 n=1 Tax=Halichoerus grypus TaxID=9711 RepID=UPI001658D483|nr:archaemetzincin-1 isoform X2 [Halichoerus grypus]